MRAVFAVLLQRVDGNDRFVVVVKRIVIGRDVSANALEAGTVEPGQRKGKSRPEFLLKLSQHRLHRDHQNAPALSSLDQFGKQDATFDRFPETYRVGDEDSLPRLGQCQTRWLQLEREDIHCPSMPQMYCF